MGKQKGIPKQWQEKICPRCEIPLTKDNHMPGFIIHSDYRCKGCQKKYYEKTKHQQREYRDENKDRLLEYQQKYRLENAETYIETHRKYRERNKEKIRKAQRVRRKRALDILGGICVYCGCQEFDALQINHINGIGKKGVSGQQLVNYILNGKANISELEVTCAICNTWHYFTKLKNVPNGWTISWKET